MLTMGAFYESVDPGGAFNNIAAVPDQHLYTSGDDIRVPEDLQNLIMEAALINDASLSRVQIVSPTLRSVVNMDVEPVVQALVFGSPHESIYHPEAPIPLTAFESINFSALSDPASGVVHYGIIQFSDGILSPIGGPFYTVRATGAASLSAGAWVNTALTFSQTLPVGRYQIVGMRARGTNLVAARLVFVGGRYRPGVCAVNAIGDRDPYWSRYGRLGIYGEFHTNTPPTVDCLGVTDTAQVFLFDLLWVG